MSHDPNHSPETPGNSPRPEHQPADAAPGQDQHPRQSGPEEAAQQPQGHQGQSQYDQNQYGQNQYAQNHYGQGQQPQGQYAQGQQGQPGYGQPQYPQGQYGHPASSGGPQGSQPRKNNVVGIIALVAGIIGLICACIPGIMILGWLLLPVAFVLGIISLFLKGKKWPGIVGLVLSVLGSILGVVVFLVVMAHSVSDAADDISDSSSSSSASASATSGSSQTAHFGDTYRWDDGLEISVGKPQPFTPSDTAATGNSQGNQFRKFQVTVHNGTKEPVDASSFTATTQSGGKQAEEVMDSEKGIGLASGKIQPGKDLNYTIVFGVADPSDISMDIDAYVGKDYSSHETTFQTK